VNQESGIKKKISIFNSQFSIDYVSGLGKQKKRQPSNTFAFALGCGQVKD